MFRRKDVPAYTVTFTVLSDVLAIYLAFGAAWWMRFGSGLIPLEDTPGLRGYLALVTLWAAVLVLVFHLLGLYNIRMPRPFLTEVARVTQGIFITMAILFALSFYLRAQFEFSRATVTIMAPLSLFCVLGLRNLLRAIWGKFLRKNCLLQRVLIIGWGDRSAELARSVKSDVNSGREILGVLTDENPADLPSEIQRLGRPEDLLATLEHHEPDEVILGTLQVPHQQISDWILICEQHLVQFRLIPDLFEILASRVQLDFVSGVPLLGLGEFPLDRPFNRIIKRILDALGALVGLVASAPLMAAGAVLVRLESPGPVFYVQERCGRDGTPFRMFKLRTMRADAEQKTGPVWASENDPRRTRFGAILRKFNVDETPQFWNVFRGEMSLVGPRPERPFFVEQFKEEIRHYMPRHAYKPGMTGWAQVNGLRGNTPLPERVRYDLYYFENWSLWFDIRIMIATLFSFRNAY
ncbi:MAG: undecaprenyl-phosphate glucose phosphotransferase [Verrucomicrobia bacterium]|nr:undecaprenyl-phosphate glucose phosphotransferase [Verrucomicrobiota bacterium]